MEVVLIIYKICPLCPEEAMNLPVLVKCIFFIHNFQVYQEKKYNAVGLDV